MRANLIILSEAESTQDVARDLALQGEPEGTAVMALRQTKGRGRMGHTWISPPGKNLALSLVLRPMLPANQVPLVGLLAAVAVAQTVEGYGVTNTEFKWPNDVLVSGRKLAGILSEGMFDGGCIAFMVLGLGLNVNADEEDFPPELRDTVTSLKLCSGSSVAVEAVATTFVENMAASYRRMNEEGCGFVQHLWEERWAHRGSLVVRDDVIGAAMGIDPEGALLVQADDGRIVRISSGEVEIVPGQASSE